MDPATAAAAAAAAPNDKEAMVDPFLVEALQNPRHRLTILRMELDVRKFIQNTGQQHFEFQHFPTSYLRLAAHRVAQHYGLQTMVQEGGLDGNGNRILVIKTAGSRLPAVRLSDIPAKQLEDDKAEQVKIVIRPRPSKASAYGANDSGMKRGQVRSVEERKEEYDRARARIFSSPSGSDSDDTFSQTSIDRRNISLNRDDNEVCRIPMVDVDKNTGIRDGSTQSRVAILRDREKDRSDPDYDRSYERYVRNVPAGQSFGLVPFNMQKIQHPFGHFDAGFTPLGQMPRPQASLNYMPPSGAVMNSFGVTGLNQNTSDAGYMQWPTAAMMYAHSYDQLRHGVFQAPVCQQPLSFDYSQNH
ncbi:R3H domain-containing protein 1 [Eucalyptus grandis]|uniref:R3H domain-containing protein 1 n=1 Tax=Eucalyptus grandis TaxID=71139 RepID=UPI00192E7CA5|nr:R3H domain-containing protein 1 [Eucalyptus grandis]